MAFLESIVDGAKNKIDSVKKQIKGTADRINELKDLKSEIEDRVLTPSISAMDHFINNKLEWHIQNESNPLITYQVSKGSQYGVKNVLDWVITKNVPLGGSNPIYRGSDISSDSHISDKIKDCILKITDDFLFGYDYISQTPLDGLSGSYGLDYNIDALDRATQILNGNLDQIKNAKDKITDIIKRGVNFTC